MSDALTRLLFEDLAVLLIAQAVALAVVLAVHRRWMTPRSQRLVWVTLALCAGLIWLQHDVVTDREALREMVDTLAEAVEAGDLDTVAESLHPDVEDRAGRGRDQLIQYADAMMQRYDIREPALSGFDITLTGDATAAMTFQAFCDIRGDGAERFRIPSQWALGCVRTADGWRIRRIRWEIGRFNPFGG